MKAHNTYRHQDTLDIDLYVHSVREHTDYYLVCASLFNRKNNYVYEQAAVYEIEKEDMEQWDLINE